MKKRTGDNKATKASFPSESKTFSILLPYLRSVLRIKIYKRLYYLKFVQRQGGDFLMRIEYIGKGKLCLRCFSRLKVTLQEEEKKCGLHSVV